MDGDLTPGLDSLNFVQTFIFFGYSMSGDKNFVIIDCNSLVPFSIYGFRGLNKI